VDTGFPHDKRQKGVCAEIVLDFRRRSHEAKVVRSAALRNSARRASTLGLFLALFAVGSAHAQGAAQGTAEGSRGSPEQRKACAPDVYRLCPGEIPNARAITACLRRQRASLTRPAGWCSSNEG
jgi:hypothetical protein